MSSQSWGAAWGRRSVGFGFGWRSTRRRLSRRARLSRTGYSLAGLGSVILPWWRGIMGPGFLFRLAVQGAGLLLGGVALSAVSGVTLAAQDAPKAVVDGGVPTLHVYTNLIQVPTL